MLLEMLMQAPMLYLILISLYCYKNTYEGKSELSYHRDIVFCVMI